MDLFYPREWSINQERLLHSVGFFTRPFGAVFFGHLGDTWGRTKTLTVCLCVMGVASGLVGVLPSYHAWGWASWYVLVLLHSIQGLAMGGQWGGCIVVAYEFCRHDRHKGLVTALLAAGRSLGFMLSTALLANFNEEREPGSDTDPTDHGAVNIDGTDNRWRVAHALALGLLLCALHLQVRVPEPPEFLVLQKHHRLRTYPLFKAFRNQLGNMCWALGLLWVDGVVQVMVVGWGLPTLLKAHGVSMDSLLSSMSLSTLVQAVFVVIGGWVGDRVGRRKLFFVAAMTMSVGTVFYYHAIFKLTSPSNVYPLYVANILYLGVAYGTLQGAFPALLVEIFPENVRYTGVSFLYSLSRVYSSGIWPYISKALLAAGKGSKFAYTALENGQNLLFLVLYVALVALFSATSALMISIYSSGGRHSLPFRLAHRRSKVREYMGSGAMRASKRRQLAEAAAAAEEEDDFGSDEEEEDGFGSDEEEEDFGSDEEEEVGFGSDEEEVDFGSDDEEEEVTPRQGRRRRRGGGGQRPVLEEAKYGHEEEPLPPQPLAAFEIEEGKERMR